MTLKVERKKVRERERKRMEWMMKGMKKKCLPTAKNVSVTPEKRGI